MFDPAHLSTFVTVARTLSFTRAAEELGLKQSTVSQHVRKLETVVGRELFTRDSHSVALTSDGDVLLGFARSILGADRQAMVHFSRSALSGVVRFGLMEGLCDTAVPAAVEDFLDGHPGVRVELAVRPAAELDAMLAAGRVDLVLADSTGSGRPGKLAWRDRLVWVGRAVGRVARIDRDGPVPLVLPAGPSAITARAVAALRQHGLAWHTVATSRDVTGLWAAVRAGLGVTAQPETLIPRGLRDLAPDGWLPALGEIEFLLRTADGRGSAVVQTFGEVLLARLADLVGISERIPERIPEQGAR